MYLAFGSEILTHSWVLGGWAVGKSAKIWIVSATISPMASFNAPLSYLNKFINKRKFNYPTSFVNITY